MNAKQARKLRQYARAYVTGEVRTLRTQISHQLATMQTRAEAGKPRLVPAWLWERLVSLVLTRALP